MISSSSITRLSASLASTAAILLTEVLQLPELPLDLPLHIERLLPLPLAPLVARDHQLAHLVTERAIFTETGPGRVRGEQFLDLRVDVQRLAALGDASIRSGLDHLTDLLLADLGGDGVDGTLGALREVLLEREIALADPVQGVAGAQREDQSPERQRDEHHDDQNRADLEVGNQRHRHTLEARAQAGKRP